MEPNKSQGPVTRSQTKMIHPIGTIVRKKFNKTWYEGEVTDHDLKTDFYHIKQTDGDAEDMTFAEVKQHKKPLQQCGTHSTPNHQLIPSFRVDVYDMVYAMVCE